MSGNVVGDNVKSLLEEHGKDCGYKDFLNMISSRLILSFKPEDLFKREKVQGFWKTIWWGIYSVFAVADRFFSGRSLLDSDCDDGHDDITRKVYRRLQLRHSVLSEIHKRSADHEEASNMASLYKDGLPCPECFKLCPKLEGGAGSPRVQIAQGEGGAAVGGDKCPCGQPFFVLPPGVRSYNLAVTDLFVEKALAYLNRKARVYNRGGAIFVLLAMVAILRATIHSYYAISDATLKDSIAGLKGVIADAGGIDVVWLYFANMFVKNFTFYGLVVTIAVFSCRIAKALYDQAERIKDKRHALRQGRLFVHLNGGKVTIEEMDKAFSWNVTHENAFSKFNAEASAPWGGVVKELSQTLKEVTKSSLDLAKSVKKGVSTE